MWFRKNSDTFFSLSSHTYENVSKTVACQKVGAGETDSPQNPFYNEITASLGDTPKITS